MKSATDTHTEQFTVKTITDLSCDEWHGLLASELYLLKTWFDDIKSKHTMFDVEVLVTHPEHGVVSLKVS